MVTDAQFNALQVKVAQLERLLMLKVLGNDPSTNFGLQAQVITVGAVLAGSFTLTLNGVTTVLNNDVDGTTGAVESLSSTDTSVVNGDTSFVSPKGFVVLAYDASIPGYKVIGFLADDGSGTGRLELAQIATNRSIKLENDTSNVVVTDGVTSGIYGAASCDSPAFLAGGTPGVDGALVVGTTPATIQYKDWAGVNQSATFLTAASITVNNFKKGIRTT